MLRNLSKKLSAKFPATTLSYSIVNIARLDDAFSKIFELQASPVEGQSLKLKDKKRRKKKGEKRFLKKNEKPNYRVGHFLAQKLEILIFAHGRAKMSKKMRC